MSSDLQHQALAAARAASPDETGNSRSVMNQRNSFDRASRRQGALRRTGWHAHKLANSPIEE
jgi:hypothetical protein